VSGEFGILQPLLVFVQRGIDIALNGVPILSVFQRGKE
jgi:hypothetical protein